MSEKVELGCTGKAPCSLDACRWPDCAAPTPAPPDDGLVQRLRGYIRPPMAAEIMLLAAARIAILERENARLTACVEAADVMRYVLAGPVGGIDGMTEAPYQSCRDYDQARAALRNAHER